MTTKHKIIFLFKWLYCWFMGIRPGNRYVHYCANLDKYVGCIVLSITGVSATKEKLDIAVQVEFDMHIDGGFPMVGFDQGAYPIKQFLAEFEQHTT